MSFDWKEYYLLSVSLAGDKDINGDAQAKLRSAISRAYFAVHNLARDHLIEVDHVRSINPTGEAHHQVIEGFEKHYKEDLQVVGKMLDRLRKDRGKADYQGVFKELKQTTESSLFKAKRIIELLDENKS